MIHYHIHWLGGGNDKLDWEAFSTKREAEMAASQLVRPDERFTIDQFDGDCPRCETPDCNLAQDQIRSSRV
jgi:hypothetical protein